MDYEDILLNLAKLALIPQSPLAGYFDSKTVSEIFTKHASMNVMPIPLSRSYPQNAFGVKRISGDLDKLFRMRLLKRKRVKRLFRSSKGTVFGRGYMYLYKIPTNGMKYAFHLAGKRDLSREERRNQRFESFCSGDEIAVGMMARSNDSGAAAFVIAEERRAKLPAEVSIRRRFPVPFDSKLYERYLFVRIVGEKTKYDLMSAGFRAKRAEREAAAYKKLNELDEQQTPLELLLRAWDKIEKDNKNVEIYPYGVRELAALGSVKLSDLPRMRLLDALCWVVGEMIMAGYYKLSPSPLTNTCEPKLGPLPAPIIEGTTNSIAPAISDKQNGNGCLLVTPSLPRTKTRETEATLENTAVLRNQN